VNDYGKPQNDKAHQHDQAHELIEQLNLLETVDRRITPEHVAKRFHELVDQIGDGGPPSPRMDVSALHVTKEHAEHAEAAIIPDAPRPPDSDVDRLLADQLMVDAILGQGLGGPRHQALEAALIQYAVPVLRELLRNPASGEIIAKAARPGRPASDSAAWLDFTEAECEEFARQMVADAMPVFTKAVFVKRKWSAYWTDGQPASLKTYFVNACAMQFPALHRKWLKNRRAQPAGLELDPGEAGAVRDTSVAVDLHEEALGLLKSIHDPKIREVLVLRAVGYTAAEAAQEVGLTEKAAENRLARSRKASKEERNESEPDVDQRFKNLLESSSLGTPAAS
jgi:hypothetical protein